MSTSTNPNLYGVAYAALRKKLSMGGYETEVRFGVEMIQAKSVTEAKKIGKDFALYKLPTKDGWMGHNSEEVQANMVLKPQAEWKLT